MSTTQVLILPGWHNSGPAHWQSLWEQQYGFSRVEQHDWERPLRGDWIARLEDVVLACTAPVVLVAHSLGCIQVAAWAAHSRNTARIHGALLVAPPDTTQPALAGPLPGWASIARQRLPFRSTVVGSSNDPYCSTATTQALAGSWGAQWIDAGALGHLNSASGVGQWPAGLALLAALRADLPGHPSTAKTDLCAPFQFLMPLPG